MLPNSKLNSIETLVSQALIDLEMKYKKMKENSENLREKQENMRLNSVNSKTQKITIL